MLNGILPEKTGGTDRREQLETKFLSYPLKIYAVYIQITVILSRRLHLYTFPLLKPPTQNQTEGQNTHKLLTYHKIVLCSVKVLYFIVIYLIIIIII